MNDRYEGFTSVISVARLAGLVLWWWAAWAFSIICRFEDIELQVQLTSAIRNMFMAIEIKEKLGLWFTITINGHFHFFMLYVLWRVIHFLCGYNCNVDTVPYTVLHLTCYHSHFLCHYYSSRLWSLESMSTQLSHFPGAGSHRAGGGLFRGRAGLSPALHGWVLIGDSFYEAGWGLGQEVLEITWKGQLFHFIS